MWRSTCGLLTRLSPIQSSLCSEDIPAWSHAPKAHVVTKCATIATWVWRAALQLCVSNVEVGACLLARHSIHPFRSARSDKRPPLSNGRTRPSHWVRYLVLSKQVRVCDSALEMLWTTRTPEIEHNSVCLFKMSHYMTISCPLPLVLLLPIPTSSPDWSWAVQSAESPLLLHEWC